MHNEPKGQRALFPKNVPPGLATLVPGLVLLPSAFAKKHLVAFLNKIALKSFVESLVSDLVFCIELFHAKLFLAVINCS